MRKINVKNLSYSITSIPSLFFTSSDSHAFYEFEIVHVNNRHTMRFYVIVRYTSTNQNNPTEEQLLSSNHQLTVNFCSAFARRSTRTCGYNPKSNPNTNAQNVCATSINFTSQVDDVENTFCKIADANSDP